MTTIQGYFLDDLTIGQRQESQNTVTEKDIELFAEVSGDDNPLHMDETYAVTTMFKSRIAHGMLSAGYISALLGTKLPGPGAIYMSQSLKFRAPVRIGDTVVSSVEVSDIDERRGRVTLACSCEVDGKVVVSGDAMVMVPSKDKA